MTDALGLEDNESIVAFLYFGSREGREKSLPERRVDDFVAEWPA